MKPTRLGDKEPILDLGAQGRWYLIENQADANLAESLTGTAIALYYAKEEMLEGGHPRIWAFLVNEVEGIEVAVASLAVEPDGVELREKSLIPLGCHVTGYRNRNAYPEYAEQIEALGDHLGIAIEPNYMGSRISSAPSP